jgi:hypothetical protein
MRLTTSNIRGRVSSSRKSAESRPARMPARRARCGSARKTRHIPIIAVANEGSARCVTHSVILGVYRNRDCPLRHPLKTSMSRAGRSQPEVREPSHPLHHAFDATSCSHDRRAARSLHCGVLEFGTSAPRHPRVWMGWLSGAQGHVQGPAIRYVCIARARRPWAHKSADVTIVSPSSHFNFTPLLASCAVGTLEYRSAIEPVCGTPHVSQPD